MTWCVVRRLESGRWHLVSAVSFPTQARAQAHRKFVLHAVAAEFHADYCVARIVVDDPDRVVLPVQNRPGGVSPLFDWEHTS